MYVNKMAWKQKSQRQSEKSESTQKILRMYNESQPLRGIVMLRGLLSSTSARKKALNIVNSDRTFCPNHSPSTSGLSGR